MSETTGPRLVVASLNANKIHEFQALLTQSPPLSLADFPVVSPVIENGSTLAENARLKASGYARQLREYVLADDTGLEVDALNGAPGVRSARYAGEQATMQENRVKLLADLESIPDAGRTARFVCHLAMADPDGNIINEASGICEGRIRREATGTCGFGYDSIFEVASENCTLAELSPHKTAILGHRGRALRALFLLD